MNTGARLISDEEKQDITSRISDMFEDARLQVKFVDALGNGPVEYTPWTAIELELDGKFSSSYPASFLVDLPNGFEWYSKAVMRDKLGINLRHKVPTGSMISRVGPFWPEKSSEVGRKCYRVARGVSVVLGDSEVANGKIHVCLIGTTGPFQYFYWQEI